MQTSGQSLLTVNEEFLDDCERNDHLRPTLMRNTRLLRLHINSNLQILVDSFKIRNPKKKFIEAVALLPAENYSDRIEIKCIIACNEWSLLSYLHGQINLLEHLDKFIPQKTFSGKIGLVTFQNGIQNSFEDFQKMGDLILNNLTAYQGLVIGLYNPTKGMWIRLHSDLYRLNNEWLLNHGSVLILRQAIQTLATLLPKHALWAHIAHREGGLIASQVIGPEGHPFDNSVMKFMKEKLITLTYGGVGCVPKDLVKLAINNYSQYDIAMRYAKPYLDRFPAPMLLKDGDLQKKAETRAKNAHVAKPEIIQSIFNKLKAERDQEALLHKNNPIYIATYPYVYEMHGIEVTIVERKIIILENETDKEYLSPTTPRLPLIKGDHDFAGDTYQVELQSNLEKLREKNFL